MRGSVRAVLHPLMYSGYYFLCGIRSCGKGQNMKISIGIPGKPDDKAEYYIKCRKPEQLEPVLEAVRPYATWKRFTDRSLHALDCTAGEDELREAISQKTGLDSREVFVIDPYRRFWPYNL